MPAATRVVNGYRLIYMPDHPNAMRSDNWDGYIYEHIHFAQESIGRPLADDEEIHHLDFNRANNRVENLLVLTKGQHAKLHNWLRRHGLDNEEFFEEVVVPKCERCLGILQAGQSKYCSSECAKFSKRKVPRPDKETLADEIRKYSYMHLSRKYGVSDNAIRKWARGYGLV
jgi:hypothetical protein